MGNKDNHLKLLKSSLQVTFNIITVVVVLYLVREISLHWPLISNWRTDWKSVFSLSLVAVLYGISLFLIAEMWQRLLQLFHPGKIDRRQAYSIYSRTQITKYLPGNIFQYVGRHILLADFHIGQTSILKISIIEIVLMISGALVVAFIAIEPKFAESLGLTAFLIRFLAIVLVAGLTTSVLFMLPGALRQRCVLVSKLMLFSIGFFICQGIFFLVICMQLNWQISVTPIFASTVSWIAGFVVPGSPGGLGVREFSLYFLLKQNYVEGSILIAATLFRAVTLFGDVVCFLIGCLLRQPDWRN